ncbi:aminopeptidase P family protein [Campylobacter cuniculorum]|uniref:aminopeptidase P family protein n=1 Tax=Campylobacter cuniculorum TaxID=374106 RepID=UPI0023F04741|nr:aminopeptidase P family protein [Campylobacter cuniculorum]
MNIYQERIAQLRKLMLENKIDIYMILTSDPHLSEYLSDFYQTRAFVSGFTGSAGTLIITQNSAFLFTDGRYYLQAKKELLGSMIVLQKQDANHSFCQWLEQNCDEKTLLATDFSVLPLGLKQELDKNCKAQILHKDLVSVIWDERPHLPKAKIYEHEAKFCSYTRKQKIKFVRQKMATFKADIHLISSLDDIAWITNLRGKDVDYNPVFLSHLLIFEDKILFFVDENKIALKLQEKLKKDGIFIEKPEKLANELKKLQNTSLLIQTSKTTALTMSYLNSSVKIIDKINPSTLLKACKNSKEIHHIKEAMIEDGLALCRFFAWFEESLENKQSINEAELDIKITEFRAQSPFYISNSFATIAGFNENGAFVHYRADEKKCAQIKGDGLLLIDSGAQYKNGTTDITRVVPIGVINERQKRDYTLVLKAHIQLACAVFPQNISMSLLDSLARKILWSECLDYAHGTGHGVGYFLNVHEAPQSISYFNPLNPNNKAKEGMLTSIEPGIYRKKLWGIRLENLALNVKFENPKEKEFGTFLRFEILTLCPFEPKCIDTTLLNCEEKAWLNAYHKKVYEKLAPKLKGKALEWLKLRTKAL